MQRENRMQFARVNKITRKKRAYHKKAPQVGPALPESAPA